MRAGAIVRRRGAAGSGPETGENRYQEFAANRATSDLLYIPAGANTQFIALAPLSCVALRCLREAAGLAKSAEELFRITGATPFLINEALASGDGAGARIPVPIKHAVNNRLMRLSRAERESLEDLSVLPGGIPRGILAPPLSEDTGRMRYGPNGGRCSATTA